MGYMTGNRERILGFLLENANSSYTLEEICAALTTDGKGKSSGGGDNAFAGKHSRKNFENAENKV